MKTNILIVEDERITAEDLKSILNDAGYEVCGIASTGEDAVNDAGFRKPNLVLMDIKLKGDMDGIEAGEQIYNRFDIPVIFMTAYSNHTVLKRSRIAEPFGYIVKPYNKKEIVSTIEISLYKHEIEQKLKISEKKYRDLVELMNEGIASVDANGIVTYVNKQLCDMMGYTQEEMLSNHWSDFFRDDARQEINGQLECGKKGIAEPYEIKHIKKDGIDIFIRISPKQLFDENNNFKGSIATFTDITQLKLAEQQIRLYTESLEEIVEQRKRKIQQLEHQRSENEKIIATGRMAACIAHEINNPLAGIKNSFLLVKKALTSNHPYHEYVDIIESEIERISRIVRQMYVLYDPKKKSKSKFDMSKLIRNIIALLEPKFNKHGIKYKLAGVDNPLYIESVEDYVTQAIFNITRNAIEASPPGELVFISLIKNNCSCSIHVRDYGTGIAAQHFAKIFEPFYSTKQSSNTEGLGLGLTVTKSLIEAIGGSLSFESEINNGTNFKIKLPDLQFGEIE